MRFPSFNPTNFPPKQETSYIALEDDILLAKKQIEEIEQKYNETKNVVDKIDLEEAKMRLELLEQESREGGAANEPNLGEDRKRA